MTISGEFRQALFTLVASIIAGALAGSIAGWLFVQAPVLPNEILIAVPSQTTGTAPMPDIKVIPVDRTPLEPIVPPAFAERRTSSIATVYAVHPSKNASDLLLREDVLTLAVAITSDGWFVAPQDAIEDRRIEDLLFWHDGRVATATKAVADDRGGVIFFKTDLDSLTSPAFARYQDVSRGLAAWLERRSGSFEAVSVTALNDDADNLQGRTSRRVFRRLLLTGLSRDGHTGAPVWGMNGTLLGIVDSGPDEPLRVLPASAWSPSLSYVLLGEKVMHADLGVRAADLVYLRLLRPEEHMPKRGAWLLRDKAASLPAIDRGSAAAVAGLKEYDVIQRIDRDILDGTADLAEILAQYKPGSDVTLAVIRNGEVIDIPVTLGSVVVSRELK
ncbi:PDZ domain-containing protein [candidate division WWE3 bacterium]|uniref:PDZ domain-containing protein n=1 Tax=candidate division WWE3 bacterium TaxID=2053526 RepID=A0A928TQ13_UNCKA|nr:PDZ domain-containing protein [candidate division WWE3 bacterium]